MRRRSIPYLLVAALSLTSAFAVQAALRPFEGIYTLTSGTMTLAETRLRLTLDGDGTYRYRSTSAAKGLVGSLIGGSIEEESIGRLTEQRIRPLEYRYRREGRKPRDVALRFNWEKGTVVNIINDDPWAMEVAPDTLDKLAVHLALMSDLESDQPLPLSYRIADGGLLKTYTFTLVGRETVETPAGTFRTIRLSRRHDKPDRRTEIWFAPELGYQPVRITQFRDGSEKLRLTLRELPR